MIFISYYLANFPMEMLTNSHGAQAFLRSRHMLSYSRISQHFIEAEGSLPCSEYKL
jgi:hypothetical protein